jgi:hypothetical protein
MAMLLSLPLRLLLRLPLFLLLLLSLLLLVLRLGEAVTAIVCVAN